MKNLAFVYGVRWNGEIRNGVNGLRVWCNGVSDNVTKYVFQTPKDQ